MNEQPSSKALSKCVGAVRSHNVRVLLVASLAAACLSNPSAHAISGFPPDYSPELKLIETHANALPADPKNPGTPTLVLPPPPGFRSATGKELAAALAVALANPGALTTHDLVFKAAQYSPKKVRDLVASAVKALPAEADLITEAAVQAVPKSAPAIAGIAIKTVVVTPGAGLADDAAAQAVEESKDLAARITSKAIRAAVKSTSPTALAQAQSIAKKIVIEAFDSHVGFVIEEITSAAVKAGASLGAAPDVMAGKIIEAVEASGSSANTASNQAAVTAAAVLAAAGSAKASIITAAQGASGAFDVAIAVAGNAADAVRAAADDAGDTAAAAQVVANQAFAGIVVHAAILAKPGEAVEILKAALDSYNGSVTGKAIVTEAVAARQSAAAKLAAEAVKNFTDGANDQGSLTGADAESAAIAGADESRYAGITTAILKAVPSGPGNASADVAAAGIAAAFAATETDGKAGIDDLTKAAIRARKADAVAITTAAVGAVPGAEVLADPTITALIAAGAVAGDTRNAAGIAAAAKGASATDSDSAIDAARSTVSAVAANKKNFFNITLAKLADPTVNTSLTDAFGIIYGAGVVNPNGAAAVAAAVVAQTGADTAAVQAAATRTNRRLGDGIGVSVNVASLTKTQTGGVVFGNESDPAYLAARAKVFDIVSENTFNNQKLALYVATGAVAVQPDFANVISHAALFRAPTSASKVLPVLFAYARLDVTNTNTPAAAAAITSQGVDGILEAKLDAKRELSALKLATIAAVKAAVDLTGPSISELNDPADPLAGTTMRMSVGPAGSTAGVVSQVLNKGTNASDSSTNPTLLAVVTAAVKASKRHYLEIVQAAVQTAVATIEIQTPGAGAAYLINGIIAAAQQAAKDSAKFSYAQIVNVATFAKAEGVAKRLGAGAAGIANYGHFNVMGTPVSDIHGF